MYDVSHVYNSHDEREDVINYIDTEIGLDYELDDYGDGTGHLQIFEMLHGEYVEFKNWLESNKYI